MLRKILILTLIAAVTSLKVEEEIYDDSAEVLKETVETHKCGANEVWMICGTCEHKCGEKRTPCPRICKPPQCQCPPHKGFRRNANGDCVRCN
ncbi:unnamed protein product [Cylicocyclus nassatus]|uniref:Uncharacterized protein n=1 Tax=Cylicocyclus nassatus TaxID=53992 RepID=A0AA36MDN5_CYLNA|nr:unnamed protein product [Cylicocyclus nassatus]